MLDLDGGVVAEGAVKTTEAWLRMLFEGKGRMRIALEAGTHSPWISRLLIALGHEVLVANPRKLRLIAESDAKHDRADAQFLARLAHVGPALLAPIHTRSAQTQIDLTLIRAREVAVQTRTKIVNAVRGMVKSTGHRLPASPTLTFARKATEACPEALQPALLPLLRLVQTLTDDIAAYDRLVVEKARAYPDTEAIQTIHGVGALTAVAFVLVLNNDRSRFTAESRCRVLSLVPDRYLRSAGCRLAGGIQDGDLHRERACRGVGMPHGCGGRAAEVGFGAVAEFDLHFLHADTARQRDLNRNRRLRIHGPGDRRLRDDVVASAPSP